MMDPKPGNDVSVQNPDQLACSALLSTSFYNMINPELYRFGKAALTKFEDNLILQCKLKEQALYGQKHRIF